MEPRISTQGGSASGGNADLHRLNSIIIHKIKNVVAEFTLLKSAFISPGHSPIPGNGWKEWGSNPKGSLHLWWATCRRGRANTYSSHSAIIFQRLAHFNRAAGLINSSSCIVRLGNPRVNDWQFALPECLLSANLAGGYIVDTRGVK